jgi:hypothetical protein
MARRRLVGAVAAAALAGLMAACAPAEAPAGAEPQDASLRLRFDDVLAPGAFSRKGPAVAEADGAAPGLWAVVPGLPRPERARVEHLATGATVDVALFAGPGGPGGATRLSPAAAAALGLGAGPAQVRVTALRREPRLARP